MIQLADNETILAGIILAAIFTFAWVWRRGRKDAGKNRKG